MKKILLLMILAGPAAAQQPNYVAPPSTGTYSGVTVSAASPTEIDNWNKGVQGSSIPNRSGILFTMPSGKMNCAFDNQVATVATSGKLGLEFTSGVVYSISLPNYIGYWCLMQGSSSQGIAVQQFSPWKPGTRSIP